MTRVFQVVGSLVALAIGLYLLNWRELLHSASRIDPGSLLTALSLAVASIALTGLRWIYIVRRVAPAPALEQWRLYCLGTFFNSFTPANIGGDMYRVVTLRAWTPERSISGLLAAVTVERLLGLASFLAGYLLALGVHLANGKADPAGLPPVLKYPAVFAAAGLGGMAVLPWIQPSRLMPVRFRSGALGERLAEFEVGARLAMTGNLWRLAALSLLAWASWAATVFSVGAALHLELPFAAVAMIVSLTEIIRLIPISFQGIGIREGAFSALVGLSGGSPETGFVVAAVAYATLSLALALAGAAGAILGLGRRRRVATVNSPPE